MTPNYFGGESMTPKEFLQQAYYAQQEIEIKLEQIARLQALATRTTKTLKDVPTGKGTSSVIESAIVAISEQTARLADEIKHLVKVNEEVAARIMQVKNPQEQMILKYRYLCFLPWASISYLLKSSERSVFLLHQKALRKFSEVLQ